MKSRPAINIDSMHLAFSMKSIDAHLLIIEIIKIYLYILLYYNDTRAEVRDISGQHKRLKHSFTENR